MVHIDLRSLIYQRLQPSAQAAGCKLLIADAATFKSWRNSFEKKAKALNIAQDQIHDLYYALENYGCLAILKSSEYKGSPEIAQAFAKFGLKSDQVHYLKSANAEKYPVWGDLDSRIPKDKRTFLYWFAVILQDSDGGYVYDNYMSESKMTRVELDNFYKALKQGEIEFDFTKKDGSKRHARGTLNPKLMPSQQEIKQHYASKGEDYDALMAKLEARKDYMPYYWDIDKGEYRQFHVSRFDGSATPLS